VPQASAIEAIEEFKERTLNKLRDVRCPDHNQAPRVNFRGRTLHDVSIQMTACCHKLAALANQKIGEPRTSEQRTSEPRTKNSEPSEIASIRHAAQPSHLQ
jgi:hypothetical protein